METAILNSPPRTKFKANEEPRKRHQRARFKHANSAAALRATANETRQRLFCSSLHDIGSCSDRKITMEQKKSLVTKHGRCFRCQTYGHFARQCKRKKDCPYCKGRHVPSMCNEYLKETEKDTYFVAATYELAAPSKQASNLCDNSGGTERRTGHFVKKHD